MTAKVARGGALMDKPRWVRSLAIKDVAGMIIEFIETHAETGKTRTRGKG
jgi:hypothetical protein